MACWFKVLISVTFLMLMALCRWISTHLSSLALLSPGTMAGACAPSHFFANFYHLRLDRHCAAWFMPFTGWLTSPWGYCTDPCMGLFEGQQLSALLDLTASPFLPPVPWDIGPSVSSTLPPILVFRNLMNPVHLAWKRDSWIPRGKSLGFFGTTK